MSLNFIESLFFIPKLLKFFFILIFVSKLLKKLFTKFRVAKRTFYSLGTKNKLLLNFRNQNNILYYFISFFPTTFPHKNIKINRKKKYRKKKHWSIYFMEELNLVYGTVFRSLGNKALTPIILIDYIKFLFIYFSLYNNFS